METGRPGTRVGTSYSDWHLEPNPSPQGTPGTSPSKFSPAGQGRCGVYPPAPVHHWVRAAPREVEAVHSGLPQGGTVGLEASPQIKGCRCWLPGVQPVYEVGYQQRPLH